MGRKSWNKFTDVHPAAPAFSTAVSASLGKKMPIFDKNGRKLPTPYALLLEWLTANLVGDWTSTFQNGLVLVKIASTADVATILKRFPAIGASKMSPASANTTQINYSNSDYADLLGNMKYKLK